MSTLKLFTTVAAATVFFLTGCSQLDSNPYGDKSGSNALKSGSLAGFQATVPLATAANFAVLAGTTVTNDGASVISQDLGVSPGTAITGFQPAPINTIAGPGTVTAGLGVVNGTIYAGGPVATQAHNDAVVTYNYLVAQVPNTTYAGVTQLDGLTFTPGVYSFAPSANLLVNGTVYLDFQGNSNALFIFQMGTTLVTMAGSNVIALNNPNQACIGSNVFWAVGSSATLDGTQFIGNVIAYTTITMTYGSTVSGRIWALNGAVTMITDTINACGSTVTPTPVNPCRDFVTGGGWINGDAGQSKSTFGVSGGIKHAAFWGQLSYNDHAGVRVKSTSVTNYLVINPTTRQMEGVANINGTGSFTYQVTVVDNGQPGRSDSFSMVLSNGYSVSGNLNGGNIQLHKKCEQSGDRDEKESYEDKDERDGCNDSDRDSDKDSDKDHNRSGHRK